MPARSTAPPRSSAIPSDELPEVELHPAFMWDCDRCGKEQFVRAVSHLLDPTDPDDRAAIDGAYGPGVAESLADDPDRKIVRQMCPSEVECEGCGAEFDTASPFDRTDGDYGPLLRRPKTPFVVPFVVLLLAIALIFFAGYGLASLFHH